MTESSKRCSATEKLEVTLKTQSKEHIPHNDIESQNNIISVRWKESVIKKTNELIAELEIEKKE